MAIALDQLNRMTPADFTAAAGDTFERAPWIADAVAAKRPFATVTALHEAMMGALRAAPPPRLAPVNSLPSQTFSSSCALPSLHVH